MRWFINEASLQGQFEDASRFESSLRQLVAARARIKQLRAGLVTSVNLTRRTATAGATVGDVCRRSADRDFKRLVLAWLDTAGPFLEADRLEEADDYFECLAVDVTDGGLGEAARRIRMAQEARAFSWPGGKPDFAKSPLPVDHGVADDRFAQYLVPNCWTIEALSEEAQGSLPSPSSWNELADVATAKFAHLTIGAETFENRFIQREPFSAVIADRVMSLLGLLDAYASGRAEDGSEGPLSQEIIRRHFTGARAAFVPESETNQRSFRTEMTFRDPADDQKYIVAHWHGRISYRFFRLHFEWPVPADQRKIKVLYCGPKITRS